MDKFDEQECQNYFLPLPTKIDKVVNIFMYHLHCNFPCVLIPHCQSLNSGTDKVDISG